MVAQHPALDKRGDELVQLDEQPSCAIGAAQVCRGESVRYPAVVSYGLKLAGDDGLDYVITLKCDVGSKADGFIACPPVEEPGESCKDASGVPGDGELFQRIDGQAQVDVLGVREDFA